VATPIGNLADLTDRCPRAILGAVDVVACEDTRHHRRHAHAPWACTANSHLTTNTTRPRPPKRLAELISLGKSVAVVSDAGTPGLSDPGFRIVRACRRRGLPVVPRAPAPAPSSPC